MRGLAHRGKIATEAKLDGKFLVSTSDAHLSTEDIALGYKQLHEIARVNRDLKHTVAIRPAHHRREDRIRAHILLCGLALLLIRAIENDSAHTWNQLKRNLRPMLLEQHATQHGIVSETNAVTSEQKRALDALRVKPPARFLDVLRRRFGATAGRRNSGVADREVGARHAVEHAGGGAVAHVLGIVATGQAQLLGEAELAAHHPRLGLVHTSVAGRR